MISLPGQKTVHDGLFLLLALAFFIPTGFATAQTWTQTTAPTNSWRCIACSADGSKLVAGQWPGTVYISTNSGGAWTPTTATNEYWNSVASSADGCKLLAVAAYFSSGNPGGVFTSTNSGATWVSNSLPPMYWGSAASSADGNTLVVVAPIGESIGTSGAIFSSTNSGINWTSNTFNNVVGVVTSADGKKMFAVGSEQFLRSTNSGITWIEDTNAPVVYSIASPSQYIALSADGTKLVLCVPKDVNLNPGPIYVSTNSGDTWSLTSAPSNIWEFVTSSADGSTIVAVPEATQNGTICLSTNGGETWTTNSPISKWGAVSSSADGGKLAAAAASDANSDKNSGPIYISQSVMSPLMVITPASNGIKLSWLVPSTNFVLQQSPDLSVWKDTTNSPVLNPDNLQNEVTIPSTNNAGFYRLKTP